MLAQTITKRKLGPAPCKDCQDRHGGCHAECDRYAAWKAQSDARRNEIFDKSHSGKEADHFRIEGIVKGKQALRKQKRRFTQK